MDEPLLQHGFAPIRMPPRGEAQQELEHPDGDERDSIQQPGFQDVSLNFRITSFCTFRSALESQDNCRKGRREERTPYLVISFTA